jgi:predicted PurR-regulated permease PerM
MVVRTDSPPERVRDKPPADAEPRARPGSSMPARRSPGWRSADILRAAALVMGLYLALRLIWLAHPLLLTAFLGVLFGLAVSRGADTLVRFRVPRGLAAALIVLGAWGLLIGIFAWSAPTLGSQFGELRAQLPQAVQRVDSWLESHRDGFLGRMIGGPTAQPVAPGPAPPAGQGGRTGVAPTGVAPPRPGAGQPQTGAGAPRAEEGSLRQGAERLSSTLQQQLGAVGRYLFSFLSSTVAVFAGLLLMTFIAIYIGSDPDLYHSGVLHLVPHRARPRAVEVLTAIGTALRKWLLAQLVAMLVIGTVTTVALMLLGVKAALSLGIIAGLLEFIPTIGPLLSAIPAIAMGFLDSPQKALMVAVAYGLIQFLENHVLIPLLMKQGVDLPPVLTILGQALMAIVFGFLGLLVAVPLLAALMVAVKMLYVEDVVGDEVDLPAPAGG